MATFPKRRWYQYSLRSLFVLTAAVALWMGYLSNSARQQRRAVEVFTDLEAWILYDYELAEDLDQIHPPFATTLNQIYVEAYEYSTGRRFGFRQDVERLAPRWLRDWIGENYFRTVVVVSLSERMDSQWPKPIADNFHYISMLPDVKMLFLDNISSVTDDDLESLTRLKRLERLFMRETQLNDRGMRHLSGLDNLQYLSLASTKITDQGLIHLKGMTKLEMLELSDTNITDAGLKHLRGLKSLRSVYLDGTKVTEEGAEQLEAALPDCHVFLCGAGMIG